MHPANPPEPAAPATADHATIARLVPHAGSMCLLDRLLQWDAQRIVCSAINHGDADHPMRTASGLLAPCGVEYAAQAMALHGALIGRAAGAEPTPGYLASMRGVRWHRPRLDELPGELRIEATRQAGDGRQILYSFCVTHGGEMLVEGRAAVVLDTPLAH